MNRIKATRDFSFDCSIFGEGKLEKGKSYYSFGKFARDVSSLEAGTIQEGEIGVRNFAPDVLANISSGERVLFIHSGGYGDTISIAILLSLLSYKYEISFDACCHHDKWAFILEPMGFGGSWIPYPPEPRALGYYDYILSDICSFVDNPDVLLKESPIRHLAEALDLPLHVHSVSYRVPGAAKTKMRLSPTKKLRLGINFDSMRAVKSYPCALQHQLVSQLLLLGFDLYFFGKNGLSEVIDVRNPRIHDYTGQTNIIEVAALIEQMNFVLGVDSLVAHLSGILGKRTVVLLSTTGEDYFDHYGDVAGLASLLECAPCYHVGNRCPLDYAECKAFYHESIQPDMILGRIIKEIAQLFGAKYV